MPDREVCSLNSLLSMDVAEPAASVLAEVRDLLAAGTAREIREGASLSISEVAHSVGVAPASVSRWESGHAQPKGEAALRYGHLLRRLARRSRQPLTAGPVRP